MCSVTKVLSIIHIDARTVSTVFVYVRSQEYGAKDIVLHRGGWTLNASGRGRVDPIFQT